MKDLRSCRFEYLPQSSGYDSSREYLAIYIPTDSGTIRYDFVRSEELEKNCNVWHMSRVSACDDYGTPMDMLSENGEWECAVLLKGRSDFSGGVMHGNECYTNCSFIVDGRQTTLSDLTGQSLPFDELVIIQQSQLFDKSDSSVKIADHYSEHIYTKNGVVVNQRLIWSVSGEVKAAYLAMFPISRYYSKNWYDDMDYVLTTYNGTNVIKKSATSMRFFDVDNHICAEFGIGEYPKHKGLLITRNNPNSKYNKCYFVIDCDDKTVKIGEVWKAETKYKFLKY